MYEEEEFFIRVMISIVDYIICFFRRVLSGRHMVCVALGMKKIGKKAKEKKKKEQRQQSGISTSS